MYLFMRDSSEFVYMLFVSAVYFEVCLSVCFCVLCVIIMRNKRCLCVTRVCLVCDSSGSFEIPSNEPSPPWYGYRNLQNRTVCTAKRARRKVGRRKDGLKRRTPFGPPSGPVTGT